jgi:hypothetical protein
MKAHRASPGHGFVPNAVVHYGCISNFANSVDVKFQEPEDQLRNEISSAAAAVHSYNAHFALWELSSNH